MTCLSSHQLRADRAGLKPSENDYDWLGTGIYFWENRAARALEWAQLVKVGPRTSTHLIDKPAVVGATIDMGNCLDLLEAEFIEIVRKSDEAFIGRTGRQTFTGAGADE